MITNRDLNFRGSCFYENYSKEMFYFKFKDLIFLVVLGGKRSYWTLEKMKHDYVTHSLLEYILAHIIHTI